MRLLFRFSVMALAILVAAEPGIASPPPPPAAAPLVSAFPPVVATGKRRRRTSRRNLGPQQISRERVRQIQEALVREGQLQEEDVDGIWGRRTEEALKRYQQENGWQSTTVPDSRALIKLGLGPRYEGLLNPESLQQEASEGKVRDPSEKPSTASGGAAE